MWEGFSSWRGKREAKQSKQPLRCSGCATCERLRCGARCGAACRGAALRGAAERRSVLLQRSRLGAPEELLEVGEEEVSGAGVTRRGDTGGGTAGGDLLQPSPPARGRGKAGTARGCGSRRTYLPVPSALPRCQLQLRAEPPTDYRGSSGPNPDRAGIKREPGPAPPTTAPNLRAASTRTYGEAGGEGEAHAAHGPAATGHGHRGHPAPRAGNGRAPERGGGGTNVGASRTGGEREQRDFAVPPPPEPLRASLLVLRAPLTDELLGFVHPQKSP